MERVKSHLTANLPPHKSGNLLDVNEKLHDLSLRLKDKKPEDVIAALRLVEEYKSVFTDDEDINSILAEYERLEELLPGVNFERMRIETGNKTTEQLIADMEQRGIKVDDSAEQMLSGISFKDNGRNHVFYLVKLKIKDLFLGEPISALRNRPISSINFRANAFRLYKCLPELVPYLAIQMPPSLTNSKYAIWMDPITSGSAFGRGRSIFSINNVSGRLNLTNYWAHDNDAWGDEDEMVFCLRINSSAKK